MPEKKSCKSFPQKWAQSLLILLLSVSGSMVLARDAVAQVSTSPENTQQGATPAPGGTGTGSAESNEQRVAEYIEAQQKLLKGAENIVFSVEKRTAHLVKSHPFLSGSLNGINAARIAESRSANTGVTLLFVYKQGPLVLDSNACGPNRCGLDVYADDGTGYKKALDWKYTGSAIHVSRANEQVLLFIERSPDSDSKVGQQEWILRGNKFLFKPHPHPRDCCGPAFTHPSSPTTPH